MDFDLKGLPDWRERLFGPIILNDNKSIWHKSKFVLALENAHPEPLTITLHNIPVTARQEIKTMLQRAKAQGYVEYHHQKLPIPPHTDFTVDSSDFDFRPFKPVNSINKVNASKLPSDFHLVNTELFDYLLTNKRIDNGQYQQLPGWLKEASGQPLNLFITSDLSENQWYSLLERAEHYQIELTLYCAEGVKIPRQININTLESPEPKQLELVKEPLVYVSHNPKQHTIQNKDTLNLAIEDYSYQDLMSWVEHRYENNQFTDFNERTSDVLHALEDGKTVLLYGDFSTPMLHALQPLILAQTQEGKKPWPGRLILSIDQKNSPDLNYLPQNTFKVSSLDKVPNAKQAKVLYEEQPDATVDLSHSKHKAKRFIQTRLKVLTNALKSNSIVSMVGTTGVGKTFLMRELKEQYAKDYVVYHEFEHFAEFAEDKTDTIKVLFLDEVNIANKHLTMLAPLTEGGAARVLFKGKIYPLTDKHRIVCASNPLNYGGGRVMQKLFKESDIPELHLTEIPAYYIYERMLKPVYQKVAPYMKEEAFKKECHRCLTQYKQSQLNKEKGVCVRDLQEWVVTFAMQTVKDRVSLFKKVKVDDAAKVTDIVITSSMKPLHKTLRHAIEVRKQRVIDQRDAVLGLNGCLIEGRPGMGKTELVRYHLAKSGYTEVKPAQVTDNNSLTYVKIDASLPDSIKKEYIRKAFNQGQIIWLDEVNTIIDEGFEQWINAFLSGLDPDTHEQATRPGFMLLVTANGVGMEGRSLLGPAFRGRLTQLTMPDLNQTDLKEIIEKKVPNLLDEETIQQMASEMFQLMQKDKQLTLREITPKLEDIAQIYRSESGLTRQPVI
jgi:MoxR-like ATPase